MLNSNQHEENTIKLRIWRVKTRDVECDDEVEPDIIGRKSAAEEFLEFMDKTPEELMREAITNGAISSRGIGRGSGGMNR